MMGEPPAPVALGVQDVSFTGPPPPTAGHIICAARVAELERMMVSAANAAEHERLMREMEAKELERQLRSEVAAKQNAKEQLNHAASAYAELTYKMN